MSAGHRCLNCGTLLQGRHCHDCGQGGSTQRFTWQTLAHDVPHAIFHVDRGIVPTVAGLLRRPGQTINAYLDGQRARHFNPLTLLALSAGLYVFVYSMPFLWEAVAQLVPTHRQAIAVQVLQWGARWYSLTLVVLVPLMAWINWWVFRRDGRNYAEHLVIMTFINAVMTLLMVFPLLPVLLGLHAVKVASSWLAGAWLTGAVLTSVYQSVAVGAVFARPGQTWRSFNRANLASSLFIAIAIALGIALSMLWRRFGPLS